MPNELLLRQDSLEVGWVVNRERKHLHLAVLHQIPEPKAYIGHTPLAAARPAELACVRGNAETHSKSPLGARPGCRRVLFRISRERENSEPEAPRDVENDGDEGIRPVEIRGSLDARCEPREKPMAWNARKRGRKLDPVGPDEEELGVEDFGLDRLETSRLLALRGENGRTEHHELRLRVAVGQKYLDVLPANILHVGREICFLRIPVLSTCETLIFRLARALPAGPERTPRSHDGLEQAERVQAGSGEARPA